MPKRSRKEKTSNINALAASIVAQATSGQVDETENLLAKAQAEGKNLAAVLLGRQGGLKGGKARAKKLSATKRRAIAKK
ncbi:MAG: hypothetical protein ACYSTL_02250, partial [Planctomycetota bacterium]